MHWILSTTNTPNFGGIEKRPFHYAHDGSVTLCDCRGFRWKNKCLGATRMAKDWNHLKDSSCMCLAPGLGWCEDLAHLEFVLECLHGLSRGLGVPHSMVDWGWLNFLLWQVRMFQQTSQKLCGLLYITQPWKSHGLTSAILHCQSHHKLSQTQRKGHKPYILMWGMPNNL